MKKIQIIPIDKKKEAQELQDISLTPAQRFERLFDLIEFGAAFSSLPKLPIEKENCVTIVLKKKTL